MKLFIVNVESPEYDFVSSVAVLAKSKDRAIELAIEYDDFFEDNIGEIEEVCIEGERVVHEDIMYG